MRLQCMLFAKCRWQRDPLPMLSLFPAQRSTAKVIHSWAVALVPIEEMGWFLNTNLHIVATCRTVSAPDVVAGASCLQLRQSGLPMLSFPPSSGEFREQPVFAFCFALMYYRETVRVVAKHEFPENQNCFNDRKLSPWKKKS